MSHRRLGANVLPEGRCAFEVWAPNVERMDLHLLTPEDREISMERAGRGYWRVVVDGIGPGARYLYRLNGAAEFPDPASRFQPDGVHSSSEVIDPVFRWTDEKWFGLPLRDYIIYELHAGMFTEEGTFEGIIALLAELKALGITAIELMPVAQFPGERNWGYDGACLFAVQNSYGGPAGLKRLVNACHDIGIAVVLDVVYNHFGPEGNYLREYGPYFTNCYQTPWGAALNFDNEQSDEVRRFFIENALYWQTEFHIDALRLDAVHAIRDFSAVPFLRELARASHKQSERLNRRFYLIAENDMNSARHILPEPLGGYGLDAQWSDDFHHCLHVLLTGETNGYYQDFGGTDQFARILRQGVAYAGEYSNYRQRRHGSSPALNSARQFVVCSQNHDQVGNRLLGERLSSLVSFEGQKLAAGSVLLSPFIPLLFMGEEYGERAPFQYVISHSDPELVEAVRRGRKEEFAHFHLENDAPDPQAETTFNQCKLDRELPKREKRHRLLLEFYRELIGLRKGLRALAEAEKETMEARSYSAARIVQVRYWLGEESVLVLLCFAEASVWIDLRLPPGSWRKVLDSALERWGGPGSALPDELRADGPVRCELNPTSLAVFHCQQLTF
jgi:maltooligosyltrehalose trehalohydrolase